MSVELPVGWALASLTQLGDWLGGGTPSKARPEFWKNGTVHWVSPKDMKRLMIDSAQDQITEVAVSQSATNMVPERSVLMVTRSGILEHSFPVAVNTVPVAINQDLKAWTPKRGLDAVYAAYYLRSRAQDILAVCSKDGTTVSSIDFDRLGAYPVPVAPQAEQARIVSKIEELFSDIDQGERSLERVLKLVERYRQSVLRAAVTGDLTSEWRKAHRGQLESGEALLQRILKARRDAWETAELAKMKAKGQQPANDSWKRRYSEPSAPDMAELPTLPDGWVWVSVEQICLVETGSTPKRGARKYYENGTVNWVTSAAVNEPVVRVATERITELAVKETNAKPFPVGTLIVAMYGEGKTRGKVSELGIVAATNQACAALLTGHLDKEVKAYLKIFFESNYLKLRAQAAGGVQPNLNLSIIKGTVLPLPPRAEAEAACEAVVVRQSQLAALSNDFKSRSVQTAALKQRVLAFAFLGRLVPRHEDDEPATTLLSRILEGRDANVHARRRRRTKQDAA